MKIEKRFSLDSIKDEFRIWTQLAKPELDLPLNVLDICKYGFTEILNNVIEHSQGQNVVIREEQNIDSTILEIEDDGAGIFMKLRNYFSLDSDIHALIELVKGKLTVAPETHSGEGIFFASKMFDRFIIESGGLSVLFIHNRCKIQNMEPRQGTLVRMEIANNSDRTAEHVFNLFCDTEELTFNKTYFSLSLAAFEGNLVSRSQARRITARLEQFWEIELDFTGIENIGQAFADELLRVWPLAHPKIKLSVINACENVLKMISHIKKRSDLPQP